jgi:geranylgeranyl reductase family protein
MTYDVVVVGAGPAGATAAKVLAEQHVSVLLLDKETFPREKPCGGGLPTRTLKRFPYIEKNGLVDSFSSEIIVHSASMRSATVERSTPFAAMVLRKTFDAGLVKIASNAGAVFQGGMAVTQVTSGPSHATVTLSDGMVFDASYVVVADGNGSHIARQLGYVQNHRDTAACYLEEYPVSSQVMDRFFGEQRRFHIHLNPGGIAGYGWVFPKREHVNIGIGEFYQALKPGEPKANLRSVFVQYLASLKKEKLVPEELHVQSAKGGVFPTRSYPRLYGDRFVVCGDAAGLTQPLTGEGIYYGMVSGELAARALVKALEDGPQMVGMYQQLWQQQFRRDYKRFYQVSTRWKHPPEIVVRILAKDPKAQAVCISLFAEEVGIKDIRMPLAQRLIIGLAKSLFGRL